jgi:hypothetical protein
MQPTLPNILIALGSLALVTQRNRWVVLGALLVQWVGLALQIAPLAAGVSGLPVEIVTALGCCGIFGLTFWNLERVGDKMNPQSSLIRAIRNPPSSFVLGIRNGQWADQLWLWATALVAGVAGFALAQLYPLGGNSQDLVAFYWMLLPAILALVIDGARDPVKLGVGLFSLFNSGMLLVYIFGAGSPGVILLGLAALGRLALAAIVGYSWLFFKNTYIDLNLNTLFDLRDGRVATEKGLMVVPEAQAPAVGSAGDVEEANANAD